MSRYAVIIDVAIWKGSRSYRVPIHSIVSICSDHFVRKDGKKIKITARQAAELRRVAAKN